ncbi:MAG: prolyl-tRNA synthetase associated domain-containing protein [Paludibacteraceae bacterium]|nr:prolyl-tRNA synthetase associated domain-containing protein [Paludibacteraceae bacterium]
MHLGKPDIRIYEEADKRIAKWWNSLRTTAKHPYNKQNTIFVDDLEANREAARRYGWQACSGLEALQVLLYLEEHHIPYTHYTHPEGKTIEEAKRWWHDDGSVHCKNLFFRNHKGNVHYLVCFDCDHDLAIHDLEHRLKASLVAAGKPAPGKLSFASPERMMRYLGLQPGSVSPFGLINDRDHEVILFLDENLRNAPSLSFHPNDCRGTVVISREAFAQYLDTVGNTVEYLELY